MKFKGYVQNKKVNDLYQTNNAELGNKIIPFEHILWNKEEYNDLRRPKKQFDYKINYVHGHDSSEQSNEYIVNLDNKLGKMADSNIGKYTVLYANKTKKVLLDIQNSKLEPTIFSKCPSV